MITKTTIITFILGAITALFFTHAYIVYQVRKQTIINTQNVAEIIKFLNNQIKPQ